MIRLILALFVAGLNVQADECAFVKPAFNKANDKLIAEQNLRLNPEVLYHGQNEIAKLFVAGLAGETFAYAGPSFVDGSEVSIRGYYVRIRALPESSPQSYWTLTQDRRAVELVKSLIPATPLLMTSRTWFRGLVAMGHDDQFRLAMNRCALKIHEAEPFIAITGDADYYTLKHELIHYQDVREGRYARIKNAISGIKSLTEDDLTQLSTFLFEHRAYLHEVQTVMADRQAQVKFPKLKTHQGLTQDEYTLASAREAVEDMARNLFPVLLKLELEDKKGYQTVVNILKTNNPIEGPLGLKELFPEMFRD